MPEVASVVVRHLGLNLNMLYGSGLERNLYISAMIAEKEKAKDFQYIKRNLHISHL